MTIDDLDKLLQEMKYESFHFYFATNTIGFQFFGSQKQINYRLIINPQWRIFKNDALINSSLSCPWHEDYENEQDYKNDFKDWCDSAKYLKDLQIKNIQISNGLGDLEISWSDNSKLQTVISYDKDEHWYIEIENELKRYIMETGKVIIETIVKKVK